MAAVSRFLRSIAGGFAHYCPGCKEMHAIATQRPNSNGAQWSFDNNVESPTFAPSINIRAEFAPEDGGPEVCHYFLREGRLQFLDDCTHHLAGLTVPLPPLPANTRD